MFLGQGAGQATKVVQSYTKVEQLHSVALNITDASNGLFLSGTGGLGLWMLCHQALYTMGKWRWEGVDQTGKTDM